MEHTGIFRHNQKGFAIVEIIAIVLVTILVLSVVPIISATISSGSLSSALQTIAQQGYIVFAAGEYSNIMTELGVISAQVSSINVTSSSNNDTQYLIDGVYVDSVNGVAGIDWPIGTPGMPVNNWVDAFTIGVSRKTNIYQIRDTTGLTIPTPPVLSFLLEG